MAEAHAAVGFSFHVTPEGLDVKVNHQALKAVWYSGLQSWRLKIIRFKVCKSSRWSLWFNRKEEFGQSYDTLSWLLIWSNSTSIEISSECVASMRWTPQLFFIACIDVSCILLHLVFTEPLDKHTIPSTSYQPVPDQCCSYCCSTLHRSRSLLWCHW